MKEFKRRKWTEQDILDNLNLVINTLNIDYFPTKKEMNDFFGDSGLSNKICKTGGSKYWAGKMSLELKDCESKLGNKYEIIALNYIKNNLQLNTFEMKPRYPYDIFSGINVKIDVKVAFKSINEGCSMAYYSFNLEKKYPTCDIYILYCLGDDGSIEKTYIIPSCFVVGQTQIGISNLSKWELFEDRWDYIEQYNNFYNNILQSNSVVSKRRTKVS